MATTTPFERDVDDHFDEFLDKIEDARSRMMMNEKDVAKVLRDRLGYEAEEAWNDYVEAGNE